jgi:hypothetical protein
MMRKRYLFVVVYILIILPGLDCIAHQSKSPQLKQPQVRKKDTPLRNYASRGDWRAWGTVVNQNSVGQAGLTVELYDKDLMFDDLLGKTETDSNGRFSIKYQERDFKELTEVKPDLYIMIKNRNSKTLYSSKKQPRYGADKSERFHIILKIGATAKPARLMDAGDINLRNMIRYLTAAKRLRREARLTIRKIRETVTQASRTLRRCQLDTTLPKGRNDGLEQPLGVRFEYPLAYDCPSAAGGVSGSPLFNKCPQYVDRARVARDEAVDHLNCLRKIHTYVKKLDRSVTNYCQKRRFTAEKISEIRRDLEAKLNEANSKTELFDPLIEKIQQCINDYKECKIRQNR